MENDILHKLETLQSKIQKLIQENFAYSQKIANFEQILKEQAAQLEAYEQEKQALKAEIEQLNMAKAFAGKQANNDEAKKRIDGLIKEINLCIAELKE